MKAEFLTSGKRLFDEACGFLYADEAINGLPLGLLERAASAKSLAHDESILLLVSDPEPIGVAVKFGGPILVLSMMQELAVIDAMVAALKARGSDFKSVVGPKHLVEHFVRLWCRESGTEARLAMEQMIFKLERVTKPTGVAGEMKLAGSEHQELVEGWFAAFGEEALPNEPKDLKKGAEFVRVSLAAGRFRLWFDGSVPQGMACITRETRRGASVAGVYTPPEFRGRGVASALVADLSQSVFDRGKEFCVLYTDLANPTSNSIYQKVGYRPIQRSAHWIFG